MMRMMWRDARLCDNETRDTAGLAAAAAAAKVADGGSRAPFFCDCPDQVTLGQGVSIGAGCVIVGGARVSIGDGTILGARVQILSTVNVRGGSRQPAIRGGHRVRIGSRVSIGAGAIIGPGVTLADGVIIEAGAIVSKDVPHRPGGQYDAG